MSSPALTRVRACPRPDSPRALLRRTNRRVEARELLRQAVDTAHHLGAAALAERAEIELRATGAKPRRVILTGLEALTASERRIAELAADGLTNRRLPKPCSSPPGRWKGISPTSSISST